MQNYHAFNLYVKAEKAFNLAIHGFTVALTWLFHINETIHITFSPQIGAMARGTVYFKQIRIAISKMALRGKLVSAMSLKKIRIVAATKARVKALSGTASKLIISSYTKARARIASPVSLRKIRIVPVATVALFYTLGTYDASTIGSMDGSTLGTLDYMV